MLIKNKNNNKCKKYIFKEFKNVKKIKKLICYETLKMLNQENYSYF